MDDRNKYRKQPPGPLLGLWSWRYLDWVKTFKMVNSRRVRGYYSAFPSLFEPGTEFPRVQLITTDGKHVDTREFLGHRHFVLITGAIT